MSRFAPRLLGNRGSLFKVADTGIGIPPEHHETIFQEFSQVENPLQERHRGTGLGLPLCRNLATAAGRHALAGKRARTRVALLCRDSRGLRGRSKRRGCNGQGSAGSGISPRAGALPGRQRGNGHRSSNHLLRNTDFQAIVADDIAQAEAWLDRHTPAADGFRHLYRKTIPPSSLFRSCAKSHPAMPVILTSAYEDASKRPCAKARAYFCLSRWSARPCCMNFGVSPRWVKSAGSCSSMTTKFPATSCARLLDQPWLRCERGQQRR